MLQGGACWGREWGLRGRAHAGAAPGSMGVSEGRGQGRGGQECRLMSTSKVSRSILDTWGQKVLPAPSPHPQPWSSRPSQGNKHRRAWRINRLGKVGRWREPSRETGAYRGG